MGDHTAGRLCELAAAGQGHCAERCWLRMRGAVPCADAPGMLPADQDDDGSE